MLKKYLRVSLWAVVAAVLLLAAVQSLSGNWVTYFFVWPGANYGIPFSMAMGRLAAYHRIAGVVIGGLSTIAVVLAFVSDWSAWVRVFAVLGLAAVITAAVGGLIYVNTAFGDRMSLGQMSDAAVGVLVAYALILFVMKFPVRRKAA
jgi:hypothetical protein